MKIIYECQREKCGARDSDAGNNPPAPASLICWKCRYGSKHGEVGMLPVEVEGAEN